jgi:hypothetical protein
MDQPNPAIEELRKFNLLDKNNEFNILLPRL